MFVYNAENGLAHKAFDFLHKIVSPATYRCSLCAITYGNFRMKKDWRQFVEELPYQVVFRYKNDFMKEYPRQKDFPSVYFFTGNSLRQLISAGEMEGIELEELKGLIQKRLQEIKA